MRILYVEDNDDNVYMLKSRLTRAGFTVLIATDAKQGLAMASSEKPDLDPDGHHPSRHEWRRGNASNQGRACDQGHPGHCSHRQCDGR